MNGWSFSSNKLSYWPIPQETTHQLPSKTDWLFSMAFQRGICVCVYVMVWMGANVEEFFSKCISFASGVSLSPLFPLIFLAHKILFVCLCSDISVAKATSFIGSRQRLEPPSNKSPFICTFGMMRGHWYLQLIKNIIMQKKSFLFSSVLFSSCWYWLIQ